MRKNEDVTRGDTLSPPVGFLKDIKKQSVPVGSAPIFPIEESDDDIYN